MHIKIYTKKILYISLFYIFISVKSLKTEGQSANNPMTPKVHYYDCQVCLILL